MNTEIAIVEFRPAALNRTIAEDKHKNQAQAMEQRMKETTEQMLFTFINLINKKADAGLTRIVFDWTEKHSTDQGISWMSWKNCGDRIIPILESAGYRIYTSWYSDSWRRKSGRVGWMSIDW